MSARFGECPNCGTEKMYASQSVCTTCGQTLPGAEPARPPTAVYQSLGLPAQPAYVQPPRADAGPRRRSWLMPIAMLTILATLCGGLLAGYALVAGEAGAANENPTADTSGGSISFTPGSISCSASSSVTVTWRLSESSVKRGDLVLLFIDGFTDTFSGLNLPELTTLFHQESDGTWVHRDHFQLDGCSKPEWNTPGDHVFEAHILHGPKLTSASLRIEP
jgi:hypothetical protein